MRAHPFADRFPMLGAEELGRLAADIAENGLNSPIVLDSEGRILDGRNRWAACEIAGVTPETVVYEGADEAAFVLSVNVTRRHLTTGQQAMSTALVLSDDGKRENGRWKRGALAGTSESGSKQWAQRMAEAGAILDYAEDLAQSVVDGTIALDAAFRQAESRRDAERQAMADIERMQAEEDEARTRLRELAPDYMTALDNGEYKSARQAFTAWEDENRAAAVIERREQAERAKAEANRRSAMSDLYSGIFRAVGVVAEYGRRESVDNLMAEYDPGLLMPPQLVRETDIERLRSAERFIQNLITWKEVV